MVFETQQSGPERYKTAIYVSPITSCPCINQNSLDKIQHKALLGYLCLVPVVALVDFCTCHGYNIEIILPLNH
jgi:hypothetical protein